MLLRVAFPFSYQHRCMVWRVAIYLADRLRAYALLKRWVLQAVVLLPFIQPIHADTWLDATIFPQFTYAEQLATVVPGNWTKKEDAWIPVRIFGTTSNPQLTLHFSVVAAGQVEVGLRTRGSSEKMLTADGADNTLRPRVSGTGSLLNWWWEFFLRVEKQQPDTPVVVDVAEAPGGPIQFRLVLGDCWLVAGAANAGVGTPVESDAEIVAATAQGGFEHELNASIAFPKKLDEVKTGVGVRRPKSTPAFGTFFARELARGLSATPSSVRPVCVYTWSQPRRFINDWKVAGGEAWRGLLFDSPQGSVLPGLNGVVWWHGEWEVEHGNLTNDRFALDLKKFQSEYSAAIIGMRGSIAERLAVHPETTNDQDRIKAHLMWVTLQAPGVGRRTEFFDALNPPADPLLETSNPQSACAALRAAQFSATKELRTQTWSGRPLSLLVSLLGLNPGWNWGNHENRPRDASLFHTAAKHTAQEIVRARTLESSEEADFADGWPQIHEGKLLLKGLAPVSAQPAIHPGFGLREAVLEAWVHLPPAPAHWERVAFPTSADSTGYNVPLPTGTKKVRYGWADGLRQSHLRKFSSEADSEEATSLWIPGFSLDVP